jgi:eukaryotic-like serine/threonine-protein kinase
MAAALAVPAIEHLRETPPPQARPLRLSLPLAAGLALHVAADYPFGLALAPDGRRAVYPAAKDGSPALWLHDLTTGRADPLPGTEAGLLPFWSPDGRGVGFFSHGRLRSIDLESGRVDDLAEAAAPGGGVWLASGDLIVAPRLDDGLVRYHAADRTLRPWTEVDRGAAETSHRLPGITSDGGHIVFYVAAKQAARAGIWLAPLDRPTDRVRLTGSDGHGIVAGSALLYSVDGSLVMQRLDVAARALVGRVSLLAPSVGVGPQHQLFASAAADAIVYAEASTAARELSWTDRTGRSIGTLAGPVHAWDVRIAPDGNSVAVSRTDPQLATLDVWVYDEGRPLARRISPALDVDEGPVWSPDATRLAWVSGRTAVTIRGRQAMLPEERIRRFDRRARLWDWSRTGQLIVGLSDDTTREDLWRLDSRGEMEPEAYVRSPFNETSAAISPDGRWLAFASDEPGRNEIYINRFPRATSPVRLTADGGADPRWRADGREVVFRRANALYAMALRQNGDQVEAIGTTRLFDTGPDLRAYDMTRDAQRFLLNRPMPGEPAPVIRVLINAVGPEPAAPSASASGRR